MRSIFRRSAVVLGLAVITITAGSWGFLIHKTAHQLAVYELPGTMQEFFYNNNDYLQYNAPRADVRRNEDSTEGPKHFIDLEAYGPNAAYNMPMTWEEAVAKYSKDTLLEYGYVPYHVLYMKDCLTAAFKAGNKDSILFYAADLGHYVEDAHVPLHTSINYDGQLTDQKGLHSLWESVVPEIEISNYNLSTKHKATYLNNPAKAIWKAIRKANALLPDVFGKEKEITARFTPETKYRTQTRKGKEYKSYTTEFAKAYAAELKNTINGQAIASANLVADFWYTAWVDAGKPDLSALYGGKLSEAKQQSLQRALTSFRNNTLVKDSLIKPR
ncbi:hypothetical protein HNQ91_005078 [Filimonas zeae]|uniref:zinc dependent phospholipase C family protein n=1 Tax=Filimonas zeae TaxID=1737353 RepID=UPI001669A2CA|nr:zinc dependent phospholipase C family protein [Filimonas zeae]MDR6342001.1 hypothetical protein [Filimonas zeae]